MVFFSGKKSHGIFLSDACGNHGKGKEFLLNLIDPQSPTDNGQQAVNFISSQYDL